jgi:Amt family ammonium transporter
VATAAAVLAWCLGEALMRGKASMLGAASGAVAGLVAVTPAAGNVGIGGALIIGLVAGFACLWGVHGLKKMLGADDSLDVFGVHGVGGIVGALLTGVFNSPALGGPGYVADWVTASMVKAVRPITPSSAPTRSWTQSACGRDADAKVWSGVVSVIAFKLVDLMVGLRVSEEDEREGLDITSHGETAYHQRAGAAHPRVDAGHRALVPARMDGAHAARSTPRWTCATPASSWRRWTPTCSPAASTT